MDSGREENPQVKLDNDVLSSLAFPQMLHRRDNIEPCHANTCEWILDLEEYKSWNSQSHGLLWIKGKPGAGKSTVMAFLHRRLEDSWVEEDSEGIRIDFFFSARGAELQRTPLGMFRTLLNQIFLQDIAARPRIREIYEKRCQKYGSGVHDWEWTRVVLEELLTNAILTSASKKRVVVFVDALDETGAESAQKLAIYFHRLLGRAMEKNLQVQICISCRHYPIIPAAGAIEIHVEDHNCEDISRYVKDTLVEMAGDSQEQAMSDELASQLTDQAKGVFQWIHLILPLIKRKFLEGESMENIYDWSRNVPEDLREVYVYVLNNVIDSGNREQSLLLFQWVYLAEQPLSVTELRYAFATSVAKVAPFPRKWEKVKEFIENDARMRSRILTLSGSLIETVSSKHNSETVQVVHQSVNEFLRSGGLELLHSLSNSSEPYGGGEDVFLRSQAVLYRSCLVYLVMSSTPQGFPHNMDDVDYKVADLAIKKVFDGQPLLAYAARYLFIHAGKAARYRVGTLQDDQTLLEMVADRWERINNSAHYKPEYSEMNGRGFLIGSSSLRLIHIAAAANLVDVLERIPLNEQVIMERDGSGCTALHLAAQYGQKEATKWLLEHGFDGSAESNSGSTPFIEAAKFGQVAFVEWLLHDTAHPGGPKKEWPGALYGACVFSQSSVVEILLDAGADPNGRAGNSGYVLQAAAQHLNIDIVRMLLAAGADPNLQGGHFGNALQAAAGAEFGRMKTCEILLAAGADPSSQGGYYGTALQAAAWRGRINVVQILLAARVNPNVQGGRYGTALQAAASEGRTKIVQMLLAAGADPNLQCGPYGNALQAAAYSGKINTVRRLLAAGADLHSQGGKFGTALQAAAAHGSNKMVRILLTSGANPNTQCGSLDTALQGAASSYERKTKTLQTILAAGADPNLEGGEFGTALQVAAAHGSNKMVRILLTAGTNPNAQGGFFGTALQAAAHRGRIHSLQRLLTAGADPNLQCGFFGTAIQAAASSECTDIVQILLTAGADPNLQCGFFGTALRAASEKSTEIVQMLLSAGADSNLHRGPYGSALQGATGSAGEKAVKMVQILLAAEADPNLKSGRFGAALQTAGYYGCIEPLKILLSAGSDPNLQAGIYGSALQAAASGGRIKAVEILLTAGADPNSEGGFFGTALQAAGFYGHTEVVKMLLSANAFVGSQSGKYGSALLAAIHGKRSDIVQIFLDAGADPSLPDEIGRTPLHVAALTGGLDIICLFPQFLYAVNMRDGLLRTPLHLAFYFGHLGLAKKLLQAGANPCIQDSHGRNALDWAHALVDEDIILEIQKSCPEIVATPEKTQKGIIRQAIFQISSTILDEELSDPWPRARQISRLLLSSDKEEEARYIFKLHVDYTFMDLPSRKACDICKRPIVLRLYLCRECAFIYSCINCAEGTSDAIDERPPHRREHKLFELTDEINFDHCDSVHERQPEKLKSFLESLICEYPGPAPGRGEVEDSSDSMSSQALEITTELPPAAIGRVKLACATLFAILALLLRYFFF